MIKLMIVDDESSIRRGLKHYIDWNAWGNIAGSGGV